jgi:hypothetical protein
LKQLQLIQIVCINAPACASTAFAGAKRRRVNLCWPARDGEKAASGNANTASIVGKSAKSQGGALTAR